jgi:hypothetical protein
LKEFRSSNGIREPKLTVRADAWMSSLQKEQDAVPSPARELALLSDQSPSAEAASPAPQHVTVRAVSTEITGPDGLCTFECKRGGSFVAVVRPRDEQYGSFHVSQALVIERDGRIRGASAIVQVPLPPASLSSITIEITENVDGGLARWVRGCV